MPWAQAWEHEMAVLGMPRKAHGAARAGEGMELGEGWSWGRDGALLPRRAPALPGLCSVFLAGVVELLAGKPVAARVPGTGKS